MRITVTVVVIMFELTGALTYILPTMVRALLSVYLPNDSENLDCSFSDQGCGRFFGYKWNSR